MLSPEEATKSDAARRTASVADAQNGPTAGSSRRRPVAAPGVAAAAPRSSSVGGRVRRRSEPAATTRVDVLLADVQRALERQGRRSALRDYLDHCTTSCVSPSLSNAISYQDQDHVAPRDQHRRDRQQFEHHLLSETQYWHHD